jgi:predicted transcriptional regulator
MTMNETKGLRFLSRNKAVVDLRRHGDIMEDAIDRITIKEAIQKEDFVSWDEVEKKVNKKLGIHHGVHGTTNKAGRKKSAKSK